MGVFLRWGVFGIIAVAALIYVYNASKHISEVRQASPATVQRPAPDSGANEESAGEADASVEAEADEASTPACDEELRVANSALHARREGQPLDRLLRSQEIAFQQDTQRRQRLETVAAKWFEWRGEDPDAATLREAVMKDCWRFSPAP
jgi:hypothetical protein